MVQENEQLGMLEDKTIIQEIWTGGHIIGNNEGGHGGLRALNGFPQNSSINRGSFAQFQGRMHDYIDVFDLNTFVQLSYDNNNLVSNGIDYGVRLNNNNSNDVRGRIIDYDLIDVTSTGNDWYNIYFNN